jgi:glycosyltransferase involved in cell wall biosynthesis
MPAHKPSISAIITTYNSAPTIERLIRSIKNQEGINELFELELIVVDDCSTDSTTSVLNSLAVPYLSNTVNSGGPNKGRNTGLRSATGDYICITDHDDEWHQDRILSLLPHLAKADIVSSGFIVVDKATGREFLQVCSGTKGQFKIFGKNETFRDKLKRRRGGQNTYLGSLVYSARLKNIEFEEEYGMVDYDWLLRLFYNRSSIEVCKTLYTRFVDKTNLSLNENYRIADHTLSLKAVSLYREIYPGEVRQGVHKINGSLARYYYLMGDMKKSRKYFWRSGVSIITLLYMVTSFFGSTYVKRKFRVFG